MKKISGDNWWALADAGMSGQVLLSKAIKTKPFVYCREYGLFYVSCGYHQSAMALLLAWRYGFDNITQVFEHFDVISLDELSDIWLEEAPGALVLSSVGGPPYADRRNNLNAAEKRFFKEITYLKE